MPNLQLRDKFKGTKLKGTGIDLSDNKAGGVFKRPATEISRRHLGKAFFLTR